MSTEEHITQLTAQIAALQAQLTHCSWSPPPPQPSAPPPPLKPPKVSAPSPFSGVQDDLDCFKAECSLYLSMRQSKFLDERSNVLFILSYMKGGSAGPWPMQKINSILYPANPEEGTWAGFILELDKLFVNPNHQATAQCKHLNSELGAQTALHLSVSKGVIQRKRESQSSATSSSNDNSRPGPVAQAVHTGMKYVLFT